MDNSIDIHISKEQIAELPTVRFQGDITLVERREDVAGAVEYLRAQRIVGFDTETKPNFRKGMANRVSLMQVSGDERSFLFRLNKIGFCPELKELLECTDVLKVGLSLKDDFHMLRQLGEFAEANFVELQDLVKQFRITDASLQKIYAILFGERISKAQRLTNWEASTLTPAQMAYASLDAWACQRIYRLLEEEGWSPEESPYAVPHVEEVVTPEQAEKRARRKLERQQRKERRAAEAEAHNAGESGEAPKPRKQSRSAKPANSKKSPTSRSRSRKKPSAPAQYTPPTTPPSED